MNNPTMLLGKRIVDIIGVTHYKPISNGSDNAAMNASESLPAGYTFLCWCAASSVGWAGAPYFEFPRSPTTRAFSGIACNQNNCQIGGVFLAVKFE